MSCTRCSLGAPWPIHPPVTAVGLVREESRELCTPWEDGPGPGPACPSCTAGLPTRSLGSALVLHKGLGESCPPFRGWLSVFVRQLPEASWVRGWAGHSPSGTLPHAQAEAKFDSDTEGPRRLSGKESRRHRPVSRAHSAGFLPPPAPPSPTPPKSDPHLQLPTGQQHGLLAGVVNPSWLKPPFTAPPNLLLGASLSF